MTLQEIIASLSDRLTPTERRIAELVVKDPTLLAFGTVSDLAQQAHTSRPSIVRFANKLGFDGYTELQRWIQDQLSHQLSSPSQRIRQIDESSTSTQASIIQSVINSFEKLNLNRLEKFAKKIAHCEQVWILSGETSMAGAHTLQSGLSMVRPGVHLVLEHDSGRELSSATPQDCAVIFDFARYRRYSLTAAHALVELEVDLIAITDGPLSPLARLTPHWCELEIPAVGPFDSSVPVVALSELLVSLVVSQLGEFARVRIDRLEQLWQSTDTFHQYSPRKQH